MRLLPLVALEGVFSLLELEKNELVTLAEMVKTTVEKVVIMTGA